METPSLAREYLKAAESDLKAIRNMGDPEIFDDSIFGFHAQQVAEKVFKAWLNASGLPPVYTHDLSFLLHALETHGADMEPYWHLVELNGYAVRFRYESYPDDEQPLDRDALTQSILMLYEQVARMLEHQ